MDTAVYPDVGNIVNGVGRNDADGKPGGGYALTVRVINNSGAAGTALSNGSFGWSGAFGTHFWVDPKERKGRLIPVVPGQAAIVGTYSIAMEPAPGWIRRKAIFSSRLSAECNAFCRSALLTD